MRPRRLRRHVRHAGRPARAAEPARPSPPRRARPAGGAAARFRPDRARRASTRPSGRPPRAPTLSSTARCAPISGFRRRSGASARPRRISSRRSASGDALITRCAKREGSPTVASRFLRRIEALAGTEELTRLRDRGRRLSRTRPPSRPPDAGDARVRGPRRSRRWSCARISSASPASRRCAATPMRSTPSASSNCGRCRPSRADLTPARLGDVWHSALEDLRQDSRPGRARGSKPSPSDAFAGAQRRSPRSAPCAGRASARRSTCSIGFDAERRGSGRAHLARGRGQAQPARSPTARCSR